MARRPMKFYNIPKGPGRLTLGVLLMILEPNMP